MFMPADGAKLLIVTGWLADPIIIAPPVPRVPILIASDVPAVLPIFIVVASSAAVVRVDTPI